MISNKKLYGYIEESGTNRKYWYGILSLYVAEPNKSFIKTVTYQKSTFQTKNNAWIVKHALDSLSRSAFEKRMRKVHTYNIGLMSEEKYEDLWSQIIPEIL